MAVVMSTANDVFQVRMKFRLHGVQCFNVLHFFSHGSQDVIENLLAILGACVIDSLLPGLATELTFLGLDAKRINGAGPLEAEWVPEDAAAGEETSASLPTTNAAVVTVRTGTAGRSGRGRFFLPGIAEGNTGQSVLDPALVTIIQNFVACLIENFIAGDPPAANQFYVGVWSKKNSTFAAAQSFRVNTTIATMRSRKLGHGV